MFEHCKDGVYGVAGLWTLWRCEDCGAAYLDPRPSPETIGLAYKRYYTHETLPTLDFAAGLRESLAVLLRNDYLNARFGYKLRPCLPLAGRLLIKMGSHRARDIERRFRNIPPPQTVGARLLEIGPGAGAFMRDAELLGYLVEGLEPDPDAVDACRMSGFNVRQGSVPQTELPADAYEHVVLSHVVEHLHYPVAALEAILRSLKAGGRIWIAMPNLGASGLKRFGANWRGLEVPRHLVLYDQRSTNALLIRVGFRDVEFLDPGYVRHFLYPACEQIARGELFTTVGVPGSKEARESAAADDAIQLRDPTTAEYLIAIAYK